MTQMIITEPVIHEMPPECELRVISPDDILAGPFWMRPEAIEARRKLGGRIVWKTECPSGWVIIEDNNGTNPERTLSDETAGL